MPNSIFPAVVAILLRQNMGLRGPLLPFASLQKKLQSRSRETAFSRSGILLELGGNLLGPIGKAPHPPTSRQKSSQEREKKKTGEINVYRYKLLCHEATRPIYFLKKISQGKDYLHNLIEHNFPGNLAKKSKVQLVFPRLAFFFFPGGTL